MVEWPEAAIGYLPSGSGDGYGYGGGVVVTLCGHAIVLGESGAEGVAELIAAAPSYANATQALLEAAPIGPAPKGAMVSVPADILRRLYAAHHQANSSSA